MRGLAVRLVLLWLCGAVAGASVAVGVMTYRDAVRQAPAVSATLPPCDDSSPGHPVTGPCWLTDDGGTAVWPYPYAPQPLYVLEASRD